jgi:hypothetical protein
VRLSIVGFSFILIDHLGMFLRHKNIHHLNAGVHWSSSFLFSLVTEMGELYDLNADKLDGGCLIRSLPAVL